MTAREKKLYNAMEISRNLARIQYYKEPIAQIKKDKNNLVSTSFEIRVKGIKGTIYGELNYEEVVEFLNKKVNNENINLNKLLT